MSSPFLATNFLLHHAATHHHSHPLASKCIEEFFYVDDFLSGLDTVEEAVVVCESTCNLLKKAGMSLRKWRTNYDDFRMTIPSQLVETANLSPYCKNSQKALGVHWNVANDSHTYGSDGH